MCIQILFTDIIGIIDWFFSLLSLSWVFCTVWIVKERLIDNYYEEAKFLKAQSVIPQFSVELIDFKQNFRAYSINEVLVKNETNYDLDKKILQNSKGIILKSNEICMEVENTDCASLEREGREENKGPCPVGRILTVEPSTSLANALWNYASVWALWRLHNKDGFVPFIPEGILKTIHILFNSPSIESLSSLPSHCLTLKASQRLSNGSNITRYSSIPFNSSIIILEKPSARLRDIIKIGTKEFKKEFRFSDTVLAYAEKELHEILKKVEEYDTFENVTLIGIQTQNHNCSGQVSTLTENCYQRAMNHMISKHKNIIFLAIGDNSQWCRKFSKHNRIKNVKCIEFSDSNITNQVVLLSHCNHTIINNEALWAFSALLSGGDTVVCGDDPNIPNKESIALQMAQILHNWHKISCVMT